ncbi:MAG: MotA/TolQ/ExbB proton channel family protein [Gammaproteobacteria bacterium]
MFTPLFVDLRDYFEAGGPVLWPILFATILLWAIIIERYWYLFLVFPRRRDMVVKTWESRSDTTSWYARRIREKVISEVKIESNYGIMLMKTLVGLIPLLGLLGTVTGMVQVFEAISSLGSSNARAMAQGVSAAIIPTMSAMTVAVFTLYFVYAVEKRVRSVDEEIEDGLRYF